MSEVIITGATGFLGQYAAREIARAGYQTIRSARPAPGRVIECPLEPASPEFLSVLDRQPLALVHAAGSASVAGSVSDPRGDFESSVTLFESVLEAVRRTAPRCRVILISSAAIYGEPARLPVDETQPPGPISPYGRHKLIAERIGRWYQRRHGVPFAALRVFSAYGPELYRQVVYDTAQKLLSARGGESVTLYGTGDETRDFIHAEDVGRAVVAVLRGSPMAGEVYNVASGEETRIADLARLLRTALQSSADMRFDGQTRPGDPLHWRADVGRLKNVGFTPRWTLAEGLAAVASVWRAASEVAISSSHTGAP